MTADEIRAEAEAVRNAHDPANQGHNYDRCELCHYTRHPCDAYDMADQVLKLLHAMGNGAPKSGMVQDLESPDSYWNQP